MNTRDFRDLASKHAALVVERMWLGRQRIALWADIEAVVEQGMREAIAEALRRVAVASLEAEREERDLHG